MPSQATTSTEVTELSRILSNSGLFFSGILVAFLFCEVLARLFFSPTPTTLEGPRLDELGIYEKDEVLGWRPRPNLNGIHRRSPIFSYSFHTNSEGLRDREFNFKKSERGVKRMVVLGDSYSWGWGVDDLKTFPKVLEQLLRDTEVINLGVSAYATEQEFQYLKLLGLKYEPDIVLLAFCLNDVFPDDVVRFGAMLQGARPVAERSWALEVKQFAQQHLALYRLVVERVNANKALARFFVKTGLKDGLVGFEGLNVVLASALKSYPDQLQHSLDKAKGILTEMRDLLRDKNIRFIVALIPAAETIDESVFKQNIAYTVYEEGDFDLQKPYRLLEEFFREKHIELINPLAKFKKEHESSRALFLPNDFHFTEEGYALFAQEIYSYLFLNPVTGEHASN